MRGVHAVHQAACSRGAGQKPKGVKEGEEFQNIMLYKLGVVQALCPRIDSPAISTRHTDGRGVAALPITTLLFTSVIAF